MERPGIMIRLMEVSDISLVSRIHAESFPNSRSTKLGMLFVRRMYQWYILNQPGLSFVALLNKEIVGFVAGAVGGGTLRFRYTFWQIVWGFLRHPRLLSEAEMFASWKSHLRKRKTRLPAGGQIEMVKILLDSIAVTSGVRGKGVGRQLLNSFEKAARGKNATILGLGVESDNLVARHLYESCDWHLLHNDIEHNSANYVKDIRMS